MPPIQETYADRQPLGYEGQKVSGVEYDAETWIAEGATLAFGKPVSRGGADRSCVLLTAANAAKFLGVTVRDQSVRPSAGNLYPIGGNVTVLTRGAIFVRVTGAVSAGDVARFDTATARFTAAAAGGAVVAIPDNEWEFDAAAADGGIAPMIRRG